MNRQRAPPSPTADLIDSMDQGMPDTVKLSHSRYFSMTESPNGKVLGCGEEVGIMPRDSRFVLRIYNRDFNDHGKLRGYVEMSIEDFNVIHSHRSEIENKIYEVRSRQTIFEFGDFRVTVGPGYNQASKPTVEIEKANNKSSMYKETFINMMNYLPEVNFERSRFVARRAEDMRVVDEILNALAYVRNGSTSNGVIRQPNTGRRCGIITTCSKIVEQAKMILPRDE